MNSPKIKPAMCDITCDIGPKTCDITSQRRLVNLLQPKMSHVNPEKSHDVTRARVTLFRPPAMLNRAFRPHVTRSHVLQTNDSPVRSRAHPTTHAQAHMSARTTGPPEHV